MKDVLDEIVAHKRVELEHLKQVVPPAMLYNEVEKMVGHPVPSMSRALMESESGIIAEFKRKSPSKGWIMEQGRAEDIPYSYQQNGAAALSILTDEKYFGGRDSFIKIARENKVTLPILYKNFVIDEYQLFLARLCGASAVLLIAADLSLQECRSLLKTAHELNMEVLLEMHAESELDYAALEPDMCGINNRNLGTFITNVENSFRMAEQLPKDVCKVSESGISNPRTVNELRSVGFSGFLIGECFMKTENPGTALKTFIEELNTFKN